MAVCTTSAGVGSSIPARAFPGLVGPGQAVFLALTRLLRSPTTWSVLLIVLFTCASPFTGLVGAGQAVFLALVLRAAPILVFHILSFAVPFDHDRAAPLSVFAAAANCSTSRAVRTTSRAPRPT